MCARRSSTNYWYRLPTPVDTSSAALPGAELPAGKSFRLKIASVQDFCFPSAFPTWIAFSVRAVCWWKNTFQNKLCWLLFCSPPEPAWWPGCQWREMTTRGSSRPAARRGRCPGRDALPGEITAAAQAVYGVAKCFRCKVVVLIFMRRSIQH